MAEPAHVLVVAHQTAATAPLLDAVRARAQEGAATWTKSGWHDKCSFLQSSSEEPGPEGPGDKATE